MTQVGTRFILYFHQHNRLENPHLSWSIFYIETNILVQKQLKCRVLIHEKNNLKYGLLTETEHLFVVVLGPLKTWKLPHVVSFLKLPILYMNGLLSWLNPSIHLSISSCWSKVCMRRRVIIQGAPGGVRHTFLGHNGAHL